MREWKEEKKTQRQGIRKKKREEKKREKERERERRKERKRKNGKRKNDERTSERTDGQFDGWMDGWMDGSMNEWMNEWMTRMGRKKNLKINFYKLYRQVACYADVLRVLFSLGKEPMTKLLNWRLRVRLMSRSTLRASSPFGGVAKSHARTARRRKDTRALPSLLELESLLVDYGKNDD